MPVDPGHHDGFVVLSHFVVVPAPNSMGKEDKARLRRKREREKKESEESANKPATHPCGCSKADGSAMMLAECMAGQSLCTLTDGKGWECCAPFPRRHIRHGDPTSKLHTKCFKHRGVQYSSPASLARQKASMAVVNKMKQGTPEESERQKRKKAKQLGRELPTGDLRKLLRRLRPTFREILAKSGHGKLFAATMETIDRFFEMPLNQRPYDCPVAVFDVELMSPDGMTGLPVSAGLFQIGTACTPVQAKTSPRAGFAAMSGTGQVGS
jgi:hypothetical protein